MSKHSEMESSPKKVDHKIYTSEYINRTRYPTLASFLCTECSRGNASLTIDGSDLDER